MIDQITLQQGTLQAEFDIHVSEFFYVALFFYFLLPFIILYFIPKNHTSALTKRGLLRITVITIFFALGFVLIELLSNPTRPLFNLLILQPNTSEFFIVGFLWLIIYVSIFYPIYLDLLKQTIMYEIENISYKPLKQVIYDSVMKLRGRQLIETEEIPNFFRYRIPGSYYLVYNLNVLIGDQNPETKRIKVHFNFLHSIRNINLIKIIAFITFGVVLIARAQWTLKPLILSSIVDSEIVFTLLFFVFIFLNLLITYSGENLIFQREAVQRKNILELKKFEIKRPNLEELKQKARKKLEISAKKAEKEKKTRIDSFLGKETPSETKTINPEIVRMEALIRETKTILNSTPTLKSIHLNEIIKLLGGKEHTSEQEVEPIIISLIRKSEVKGEYDIWSKSYKGGNSRQRFINRMLDNIEINKEEIANLKVSGDTIEVSFWNPNPNNRNNLEKTDNLKVDEKE